MGILDYKLKYIPPPHEVIGFCSSKKAEELVELVKVQSDTDAKFAEAFSNKFLMAGPDTCKQILNADLRKSDTWSNDNIDHEDAIKANDDNVRRTSQEKNRRETTHKNKIAGLEKNHHAGITTLTSEYEVENARLKSEYEAEMARGGCLCMRLRVLVWE